MWNKKLRLFLQRGFDGKIWWGLFASSWFPWLELLELQTAWIFSCDMSSGFPWDWLVLNIYIYIYTHRSSHEKPIGIEAISHGNIGKFVRKKSIVLMGIPGNSWNRCFSWGSFPTTAANGGLSFAGTRDTFGIHGDILAGPRNLRRHKNGWISHGRIGTRVFPKNRGTVPQNGWFIKNGNPPIKMDDLGGKPTIFRKPPVYLSYIYLP